MAKAKSNNNMDAGNIANVMAIQTMSRATAKDGNVNKQDT